MTRQFDNFSSYIINYGEAKYIVTLEHIRNNVNGHPRFKAGIIHMDYIEKFGYSGVHSYTFTGHYMREEKEAEWIVKYHFDKCERIERELTKVVEA